MTKKYNYTMKVGRPTLFTDELGLEICQRVASGGSVIYSLSDSNGVRYIGQTTIPQKRFSQHCSLAQNRGNTNVNKWLYEIIQNGGKPRIDVVEFTNDLDKREKYWIKYYNDIGIRLLNMTKGGHIDYNFLRKKKKEKLWGHTLSPVQYRLMSIKKAISFFRRNSNIERAEYFEDRLIGINDKIKKVGLLEINNRLWLKYGK